MYKADSRNWLKYALIGAVLLAGIGVGSWYYRAHKGEGIYTYEPSVDRAFILDLFKKDWYWLVSDYSPNYSPEHMLDYKASSQEPQKVGNLTIRMYRKGGEPLGFVAYFMKELFEGYILFLGVGREARGHGYARRLFGEALDDLKKRGATVIRLITRTDNQRGRKLYSGMGFKEIWTDGAYVKYEKKVV
jgi:ribosomal protein S18 acetylase RimI-like enzyme